MRIVGCEFHTRYQQIAMMDEATGELVQRRLDHENEEDHSFSRGRPPASTGIFLLTAFFARYHWRMYDTTGLWRAKRRDGQVSVTCTFSNLTSS